MATNAGYDLLIEAASSFRATAVLSSDIEPSDAAIAEFLSVNTEVLEQARNALQMYSAVPLEYNAEFFEKHSETRPPLRDLALSFALELSANERAGDLSRAMEIGLTIVDLANAVRRGGLIVDALVANAIEGIAIDRLRLLRHRLRMDDARRLANGIMQKDAARELFGEIVARDRKWEEVVDFPDEDVDQALAVFPDADELGIDEILRQAMKETIKTIANLPDDQRYAVYKDNDDRNLALMRLLTVESAVIAFKEQSGIYPVDLSSLVPVCIALLPADPFTGTGFVYRTTIDGFVVYSPGPTGQDSGGSFGDWFSIQAGEADLCLDMQQYQQACGFGNC